MGSLHKELLLAISKRRKQEIIQNGFNEEMLLLQHQNCM